jgi:hypothetical protein
MVLSRRESEPHRFSLDLMARMEVGEKQGAVRQELCSSGSLEMRIQDRINGIIPEKILFWELLPCN